MYLHNFFILTFSKIFRRWYGFLFGTDSKILFFFSDTLIMQKLSTVIHILNGIKMVEILNGNEKKRKKKSYMVSVQRKIFVGHIHVRE